MFSVTWKGLMARKRRLVGTGLAVFIGVAFLAGTLVLGDTLSSNFDQLLTSATAGTDAIVRSDRTIGATGGRENSQRATLPESTVEQVRSVAGVAAASPTVEGYAQVLDRNGAAVGGNGPPRFGAAWITDPALSPWRIAEGRPPAGGDEAVINRGTAKAGNLHLGDRTIIQTPTPVPVTIVGIATFGEADGVGGSTFVAFDLATAQRVLGTPGQVTGVIVKAAPGVSQDELVARLQAGLPGGIQVLSGTELARQTVADINSRFLDLFRTLLVVFAGIALLVASLTIHNTFSIVVAQRTGESALLRALGATRRQVLVAYTTEAFTIGLVASLLGLVGGIGIAQLLKGVFDAFGFALPASGLVVNPSAAMVAVLVGTVVTTVAGLSPARRGARVPPIAAIRAVALEQVTGSRARTLVGLVLMLAGVAAAIVGITGGSGIGWAALGSVLLLAGVITAGPVIARPVTRALGWPLRAAGVTGALARQNAERNPRRSWSTATALMIGVCVVTLFTIFAASIKASVDQTVQRTFGGDLVIAAPIFGGAGLAPDVARAVAASPSVERSVALGRAGATVAGTDQRIGVADLDAVAAVLDLDVADGSLSGLPPDRIAVSQAAADEHGWHVGSPVPLGWIDGSTTVASIGAVYGSADLVGDVLVPRAMATTHAPRIVDAAVYIDVRPGVDLATARVELAQAVAPLGAPAVQDRDQYVASATGGIDLMLGIVYVLLALAILIAVMGIANTLALAVHERTRELGLLRAVGETRRQVRRMVRLESTLVAVLGTVVGLGLGLATGWILVQGSGSDVAVFRLPVVPLVVIVVIGAVVGSLAGWRPSRRAARIDVLGAIATT